MNRLAKLTLGKPSLHYEGVEKVYPNHSNALHEAGVTHPNFLTMGDLWFKQDEKMDIEK